jgi:hypothetical protein
MNTRFPAGLPAIDGVRVVGVAVVGVAVVGVAVVGLVLGGCRADGTPADGGRQTVTPADFITGEQPGGGPHDDLSRAMQADDDADDTPAAGADEPAPAPADQPPMETGPAAPERGIGAGPSGRAPANDGPSPTASRDPSDAPFKMDGMVGQVNGRPIYADSVLKHIEDQLKAMFRRDPNPAAFRAQAQPLIEATLQQIVLDALIIGEAERDLSERERQHLNFAVVRKREELTRRYGQGSPSLAERNIVRATGKSMDQTIEEFRQQALVARYLREKISPRVNVNRWDIERYFRDNIDRFAPQETWRLRLIRVATQSDADQVLAMLESQPFAEVAGSEMNLNRRDTGGLMDEMRGVAFGNEDMNEAIRQLEQGQWTGPYPLGSSYVFAYVETRASQEGMGLREAQPIIERELENRQFQQLQSDFNRRLFREGSYHSLPEMTQSILRVAMARYAGQPMN